MRKPLNCRLALLLQPRHPRSRALAREGGMMGEYVNSDKIRDTSPEGAIGKLLGEGLLGVPHMRDIVS